LARDGAGSPLIRLVLAMPVSPSANLTTVERVKPKSRLVIYSGKEIEERKQNAAA